MCQYGKTTLGGIVPRKDMPSLADDILVAGLAAKMCVAEFDTVPASELSWKQRREARKVFKKLTWAGVIKISLDRLDEELDAFTDSKESAKYTTLRLKHAETIRSLIVAIEKVGDRYVLRPDGTYAWLPLNQASIDELNEKLTDR